MTKEKKSVNNPSSAYLRMLPRWQLAEVLLGGTEALRAAGETYLPRHEKESQANYDSRLARATLLNIFEDTVETLAGKPFAEELVLGDDVPQAIVDLAEDIDLQGTNLHAFAHQWFQSAWAKGVTAVLVDAPSARVPVDSEGKPRPRTLADDREEGVRPYWVMLRPENVLAAYAESVNGRERFVHVRLMTTTIERDGFEERAVQTVRVLEPGKWADYRYNESVKDWVQVDDGQTGLAEIPIVPFYTGKKVGPMECKPPLTDLAHLNIAHWQSSSDQRNVLTVARFPILAGAGIDEEKGVTIGPNNYLTSSEGGKWYYVEHSGAAIEAGRRDLEDLENQMASYGAEFLRKRPGGETATARALDSAEGDSYLSASVRSFKDCIEQALQFTAMYLRQETGGTVQLACDFDEAEAAAPELDALVKMRASRDISRQALLNEMKRRRVLAEDFDPGEDGELLDDEAPSDGLGGMFPKGPNQPTPQPTGEDE